jgi:hypothetical protein
MNHKKHLKTLGLLALSCAIFTAGRLTVQKLWGIEYNTRTLEILVVLGVALHLLVPRLLRRVAQTPSAVGARGTARAANGAEKGDDLLKTH